MTPTIPTPECTPDMAHLPPEAIGEVATYFQALSEPTRLQILNWLRQGERNVGELAQLCGFTAANISRHLQRLTRANILARRRQGLLVFHRIADPRSSRSASWSAAASRRSDRAPPRPPPAAVEPARRPPQRSTKAGSQPGAAAGTPAASG